MTEALTGCGRGYTLAPATADRGGIVPNDARDQTPMAAVTRALRIARGSNLTLDEVIALAPENGTTADFLFAISLYTVGDIDVYGIEPIIIGL